MVDRNSDGTYNNIGSSASSQREAGVNRTDIELTARYKVQDAEQRKAQNQQHTEGVPLGGTQNQQDTGADSVPFVLGLLIIGALYLSATYAINYVSNTVNELCIFGIAFDTKICQHKKALQNRKPVASREELQKISKLNNEEILYQISYQSCRNIIGDSQYCNLVVAIRNEIILTSYPRDSFGNLNERAFLENTLEYHNSIKPSDSREKMFEWEKTIKSEEGAMKKLLIGKWQAVGCKSSSSSKFTPSDCKKYMHMTILYDYTEAIVHTPDGNTKKFQLSLSELSGSGNYLKSKADTIWNFQGDNQILMKWRDVILTLVRVK